MAPVLLWLARLDALDLNPEPQPPDRQFELSSPRLGAGRPDVHIGREFLAHLLISTHFGARRGFPYIPYRSIMLRGFGLEAFAAPLPNALGTVD